MTPQQFSELIAAECVGLDMDGWTQTATIAAVIWEQLEDIRSLIATQMSGKVSKPEYKAPKDFFPAHYRKLMGIAVDDKKDTTGAEALHEQVKKRYGNSSQNDG